MEKNNLLVSFLGLGRTGKGYEQIKYYLNSPEEYIETKFVVVALCKFFKINQLILFTTKSVEQGSSNVLDELKDTLVKNNITLIETKIIPEGKNTEELKDIFKNVLEVLEKYKNDNLYLDITHGFRSLPLIFFTSIIYLKNIYDINIIKICYGALDAGNKEENIAPIFDLSYLLELIEWSTGVNLFVNRYDSFFIDKIIKRKKSETSKSLLNLKKELKDFSKQFSNVQIIEIPQRANQIINFTEEFKEELFQNTPHIIPLIDKIKDEVKELTLENSNELDINQLKFQIKLIKKYLEKNLILQAIILDREFIVSLVIFKIKKTQDWRNYKFRENISHCLNSFNSSSMQDYEEICNEIRRVKDIEKIKFYLDKIKNIRNNFVHAGMGGQDNSFDSLSNHMKQITEQLEKLI